MSMTVPPPPPPPVTPLTSANDPSSPLNFVKHTQSKVDMVAELHQTLDRILDLSNGDKVALAFVSRVQPITQVGPVCGLVALGMASDYFSRDGARMTPESIFDMARAQNMTKSGEMFSAQEMKDLAARVIPGVTTAIFNSEDSNTFDKVLSTLLNGDLILVPYDADHNHSPANRQGHAAHWALIIGFAIHVGQGDTEVAALSSIIGGQAGGIFWMDTLTSAEKETISLLLKRVSPSQVFLCGRQGKSKHVGIWGYDELIKSNQNLMEVGGKIRENRDDYVLHPIHMTLRSQLILLQKNLAVVEDN